VLSPSRFQIDKQTLVQSLKKANDDWIYSEISLPAADDVDTIAPQRSIFSKIRYHNPTFQQFIVGSAQESLPRPAEGIRPPSSRA
jgi:hypothetical protein